MTPRKPVEAAAIPVPSPLQLAALCGAAGAVLAAAGCAGPPAGVPLPFYRCEHQIEFTLRVDGQTAVVDLRPGREVLWRDDSATGLSYSNPRMKLELGQGDRAREALLRLPNKPLAARCARE